MKFIVKVVIVSNPLLSLVAFIEVKVLAVRMSSSISKSAEDIISLMLVKAFISRLVSNFYCSFKFIRFSTLKDNIESKLISYYARS